ncbi:hypothetical protein [Acinetobacter johnsonii]|uniref:hypothetical protein n=1 Tax=Acinetobacter johnsonii TaxID=40214 RepID=UPI003AF69CB6
MTNLIDKLNNNILTNEQFLIDRDIIFDKYVSYLTGGNCEIDRNIVKKISTVIQYFYKSKDENVKREGAILLAILLDIAASNNPDLAIIAKKIFFDVGDFPNIKLLNKKYSNFEMNFGFYTNAKFDFKENLNSVPELDYALTDFQRILWQDLMEEEDVIS